MWERSVGKARDWSSREREHCERKDRHVPGAPSYGWGAGSLGSLRGEGGAWGSGLGTGAGGGTGWGGLANSCWAERVLNFSSDMQLNKHIFPLISRDPNFPIIIMLSNWRDVIRLTKFGPTDAMSSDWHYLVQLMRCYSTCAILFALASLHCYANMEMSLNVIWHGFFFYSLCLTVHIGNLVLFCENGDGSGFLTQCHPTDTIWSILRYVIRQVSSVQYSFV